MTIWLSPRKVDLAVGASGVYTVRYKGVTTLSNLSVKAYDGTQDVSATILSGSPSSTVGPPAILTLPTIQSLTAGKDYVIAITAAEDGFTDVRKLEVHAYNPWDKYGEG